MVSPQDGVRSRAERGGGSRLGRVRLVLEGEYSCRSDQHACEDDTSDDSAVWRRWSLLLERGVPVLARSVEIPPPAHDGTPSDVAAFGPSVCRAPWIVWASALSLTGLALWLMLVGLLDLAHAHVLISALGSAQTRMVGPVLIGVVAAVFVAERWWPAVPRKALDRAHLTDAGYLALYGLVGPLVTLLNTGFALVVERDAHFLVIRHLSLVPQLVVVGLILVGIDAMNWAAHVANHRWATLWRFHALHHSQEQMSVLTTFRTHPLAHATYLPALLPALVLEASGTVPAIGVIAYGCLVTLPHANLKWTYGRLGRVLVSPAFHRFHHAKYPVDGRRAVNFGFVLVCWDRLAGCAVFPCDRPAVDTGLEGRPVPIEQEAAPSSVWRVLAAQLMQPFRLRSGLEVR
jgi:sterol desaturase/sphingolipid hydroxylase (fatty acid hydroxylase superfamily)